LLCEDFKAEAEMMRINRSFSAPSLSLSARVSENAVQRYAFAVAAVLVAFLVSRALNPAVNPMTGGLAYVLMFPAVAFSAWYCGIGPSIVATVLALLGATYGMARPVYPFGVLTLAESIRMLVFLFSAGIVVVMGKSHRLHNDKLRKAQGELEDRVKERTADLDTANQNLRELSARLLQSQDDERRRIARELHDSVGQMLAALSMNLAAVKGDIDRLTKAADALTDSESLVQEMSTEVRTISHLLHPPLLDEAGLSSALRWYVEGFALRSKIKVDLDLPDDFGRLPRESETAIFRVVQECLTNIHRHSGSPVAKIRLRQRDHQVLVEIEDRGKGIPPEKQIQMASAGAPGVGIRGMRERLRQLGGTLEVNSCGTGTVVTVWLPIPEASPAENKVDVDNTPSPAAA
jgi:signal transduction histidine kinase